MLKIERLTGRKYMYKDKELKPLLMKALKANDSMREIFIVEKTIKEGNGFVWTILEDGVLLGAAYGSTVLDDKGKALLVELIACQNPGILKTIDRLMERIEQFATDNDYRKVNTIGRLGWKRFLTKLGYKPVAVEMEKML